MDILYPEFVPLDIDVFSRLLKIKVKQTPKRPELRITTHFRLVKNKVAGN